MAAIEDLVDAGRLEEVRRTRRRWTLLLIVAFWFFAIAMLTLRGEIVEGIPLTVFWWRRLAAAIFGSVLCLGMVRLLDISRHPLTRIAIGLVGALVMSIIETLSTMYLNRVLIPVPHAGPMTFAEVSQWVLVWYGYFLAWTGTQLALSYHWVAEDEQLRARMMDVERQRAEMAALRYQLNPHFLFNALNSLSTMVMEDRKEAAEEALLNMADFVRATLTSAPAGAIPLSEEVRLQQIYLEVEQMRFGDRLSFEIKVPKPIQGTKVPALILQPLVENVIRHGVAQTEEAVRIVINAEEDGEFVRISVCNDNPSGGSASDRDSSGSGLGLANVAQRLRLQFGDAASLETRRLGSGGFEAAIILPAVANG